LIKAFNQVILFIILAKILDINAFGVIGYYMTISIISSNIIDFGYRLFIVKDFSVKNIHDNLDKINIIIYVKFFIVIISLILLIIYRYFVQGNSILLVIFFLSGCFVSYANLFNTFFQSKNIFKF